MLRTEMFRGQFYDMAKDVANSVLTKSYADSKVADVALFGSTARGQAPRDIDMLILHNGDRLKEFDDIDPYGSRVGWKNVSDISPQKGNNRYDSFSIFHRLGSKTYTKKDERQRCRGQVVDSSPLGSILKTAGQMLIKHPKYIYGFKDRKAFSKLFDVHVLPVDFFANQNAQKRMEAIKSCRDPTFWYTVLGECKIYDLSAHEFDIPFQQKYLGALELFKVK